MTPFATRTEAVSMVPAVGPVCQKIFPVATSRELHDPHAICRLEGTKGIRDKIVIPERNINLLSVSTCSPLDASERTARRDSRALNDVAVPGIEHPKDGALLAQADNVAHEISPAPTKSKSGAAGLPGNLGLLLTKSDMPPSKCQNLAASLPTHKRMAEGIREGKCVRPDFDVAVKRHQLLDVIQKASDTGIRQIL
jgi:hypothetical protein